MEDHDPALSNRLVDQEPSVDECTMLDTGVSTDAGFVVPICGGIMRMPGLPEVPAAEGMDIGVNGVISGLS